MRGVEEGYISSTTRRRKRESMESYVSLLVGEDEEVEEEVDAEDEEEVEEADAEDEEELEEGLHIAVDSELAKDLVGKAEGVASEKRNVVAECE